MLLILLYIAITGALLTLIMTVANLRAVRKLAGFEGIGESPLISIIVPARNEERNIAACVTSLLRQDYPAFEIIAVNDHSQDRTGEILAELGQKHSQLVIVDPPDLPEGWLGKNWACYQGYCHARGRLLLFIDADTRHAPKSLGQAVSAMLGQQADFLTAILFLTSITVAEKMVQPLLTCMIYGTFPFALMQMNRAKRPAYAHGAYMLFRREAYDRIGGHEAISDNVFDDLSLACNVSRAGLRTLVVNGAGSISCRMYESMGEIFNGFSKNLFRLASDSFPDPIAASLFTLGCLAYASVFSLPGFVLSAGLAMAAFGRPVALNIVIPACVSYFLTLCPFAMVYKNYGYQLRMAFAFPLQILLFCSIAINAMIVTLRGKTSWKGRLLQ